MRATVEGTEVWMSGENLDVLRGVPHRRWDTKATVWKAPLTARVVDYLTPHLHDCDATALRTARAARTASPSIPVGYTFKTPPYPHQRAANERMMYSVGYGLFMDPGTGKSKCLIDDTCIAVGLGEIEACAVVCPNSIKTNWEEEIAIHSSLPTHIFIYDPARKKAAQAFIDTPMPGRVKWFILGVESLSSGDGAAFLLKFVKAQPTCLDVDESSRIKTWNSSRTKALLAIAPSAKRRRIATGTPISKGLHDAWAQFQFLSTRILGMNYFAFRNTFSVMGGYKAKQVVASKNEDLFIDLTSDFVTMARKEDCLDLPDKIYQVRRVTPSEEQIRMYRELKVGGMTEVNGGFVSYTIALVRELRLQQFTGGFATTDNTLSNIPMTSDPALMDFFRTLEDTDTLPVLAKIVNDPKPMAIPGPNPKLIELLALVEEIPGKMIIWCRFRAEIAAVAEALRKLDDGDVLEFHGGCTDDERTLARQRFQTDAKARFFVAQIDTGGIGITLTAASTVVYFSNSWRLENRIQSEDRAHRIGQTKNVLYIDLIMDPPRGAKWVDEHVFDALKSGLDYTEAFMRQLSDATQGEKE